MTSAHVVILGGGFGGLAAALEFRKTDIRVTIIDRQNYHLFVPLLYQVATAALSPRDIAEPIRKILGRYKNIDVVLGEVVGLDATRKELALSNGRRITYDRLILATGSNYSYFGHDEWAQVAPGVKTIEDARRIRSRLLLSLEKAEAAEDPDWQTALMTTIIVGGGPTGVELAGAIAELTRHALACDFRRIEPRSAKIMLVEAGPRLLSGFHETISDYARRRLEDLDVTVLLNQSVEDITPAGATINGVFTAAGTIIWAAGIKASPAAAWLGVALDKSGRIVVGPDLSVPGLDGVYAIGDIAACRGEDGAPLPALAQVAKQQGEYLGRLLRDQIRDGRTGRPFHFRNRGNAGIIGRNAAFFDFGTWRLKAWPAWILWAIIHVWLLVGFENRLLVTIQWLWRYVSYQRGARLITHADEGILPSGGLAAQDDGKGGKGDRQDHRGGE